MSDQHQPTPEELNLLKKEVVDEVSHLAVNPRVKLDDVADKFNKLFSAMDSIGKDTQMLHAAWQDVNAIVAAAETSVDLAAKARSLANYLKHQLDVTKLELDDAIVERQELQSDYSSTLSELDELQGAIYDLDQQHPIVSEAFDAMRDEVSTDFWESGAYISYDPAMDIQSNLVDVDYVHAGIFHRLLVEDSKNELSGAAQAELCEFITSFVQRHSLSYQKDMADLAELQREEAANND